MTIRRAWFWLAPVLAAALMVLSSAVQAGEAPTKTSQAIEFVKLGYGDLFDRPFRSLSFRTEELTTPEAQAVIGLVPGYNSFVGRDVSKAIGRFMGRVASWQFGREGSPVLFVNLSYWTHAREGASKDKKGARIGEKEHKALVAELKKLFVDELRADEFSEDGVDTHKIRVWWD